MSEVYFCNEDRLIIDDHLRLSGKINMLVNIRRYLIQQFHSKKMTVNPKSGKYKPNDNYVSRYYDKFLFLNKKQNTDFDIFPCQFRSCLENILIKKLYNKDWNYIVIYYDKGSIEYTEQKEIYSAFDKNQWNIDDDPNITFNDQKVLFKYIEELVAFFDKTIEMCRVHNFKEIIKILVREKNRIIKITNYIL